MTHCTIQSRRRCPTCPTDTGSGGFTHRYFPRRALARRTERRSSDAIAAWARLTYGWMGRTPDYKAALMNTLGANAEYYGQFADNARTWYKRAQETRAVHEPRDRQPAGRSRAGRPTQVKDVYVSIEKETDAGIVRVGRQGGRHLGGASRITTSWARTPRPRPSDPDHGGDVHRCR